LLSQSKRGFVQLQTNPLEAHKMNSKSPCELSEADWTIDLEETHFQFPLDA
jgi:hypothetical protein